MKKIRRKNKIKAIFVFILYVSMITFQFAYLIPYTVTRTYVSEQNVPHTVVIGKEYDDYKNIWRNTDKSGNVTSSMINFPVLALQFAITTLIAFLFYRFIRTKEDTNLQDLEPSIPKITEIEPEELQSKPRKGKHIIKRIIYIFIVACLCLSNYITYDFYLDAKNDKEYYINKLSEEREEKAQQTNNAVKLSPQARESMRQSLKNKEYVESENHESAATPQPQQQTQPQPRIQSQSQPQQQVVVVREEEHNKCEYPGCVYTKTYNGNYCIVHTCKKSSCGEKVVNGSSYCSEHKCLTQDCNFERMYGSYCCAVHSR